MKTNFLVWLWPTTRLDAAAMPTRLCEALSRSSRTERRVLSLSPKLTLIAARLIGPLTGLRVVASGASLTVRL